MINWLSSTWEASWRAFRYFNIYRLCLALLALLLPALPDSWAAWLHLSYSLRFTLTLAGYLVVVGGGLLVALRWQQRFNQQLSLQVVADVVVISVFVFASGGIGGWVGSGISSLMLVSLATASLVGRGRLVLFYAALATFATLGMQLFGVLYRNFETGTIVQAGLLSAGFSRRRFLPACSASA